MPLSEQHQDAAHEAVGRYLARLGDEIPEDIMDRNIMVWRGVYAALGALNVEIPSVEELTEIVRGTVATGVVGIPGSDRHPGPGQKGHKFSYTCALCAGDAEAIARAVINAVKRAT